MDRKVYTHIDKKKMQNLILHRLPSQLKSATDPFIKDLLLTQGGGACGYVTA